VDVVRNCAIQVSDGVELAADLYLPREARPGPGLVTLLPYNKDGLGGIAAWDAHHYFASRGYACLIVDCRGTGSSGGRPLPPFDPDEALDGVAVVEWAADQPWCDGNVGMWGVSYAATTTLRTASLCPSPLKAIAPVMGFLDPERDFVHPAGLRGCLGLGLWGLSTLAQHLTPPLLQDSDGRWERRWRERLEHGDPYIVDLLRHGPGHVEWRSRVVDASLIRIPTFCVAGWRDVSCDPTIRAYEQVRGPKKLLVGPWMHTLPDESQIEPVGFLPLVTAWWDRWLRDEAGTVDAGSAVSVYWQGRRSWRRLGAWPPDGACVRMFPDVESSLRREAPAAEGVAEHAIDPTVGARSALWGVPARGSGGPRDQRDDDAQSLAFTSPPLGAQLGICGRPRAKVVLVRESGDSGAIVVKLAHVGADGRSTLISSGTVSLPVLPAGELELRGRIDSAHEVDLVATAYEIPAGDRLRMIVTTADFPRLWPDGVGGRLALRWGAGATHVSLPVTEFDRLEPAELPAPGFDRAQPSLVLRADPLNTVTRRPGGVTVTTGDHLVMRTPQEERALDVNAHASATVLADRPGAAAISGRSTTRARTRHGELVVRAELRLESEGALVAGEVALDGRPLFTRRWTT